VKPEKKVVFTFPTTTDAIYMEHVCRTDGCGGRMIPTPTQITAGCGLAWSAPPDIRQMLEEEAKKYSIRVDGIYELEL